MNFITGSTVGPELGASLPLTPGQIQLAEGVYTAGAVNKKIRLMRIILYILDIDHIILFENHLIRYSDMRVKIQK